MIVVNLDFVEQCQTAILAPVDCTANLDHVANMAKMDSIGMANVLVGADCLFVIADLFAAMVLIQVMAAAFVVGAKMKVTAA